MKQVAKAGLFQGFQVKQAAILDLNNPNCIFLVKTIKIVLNKMQSTERNVFQFLNPV
jgi:hypothetical protein